MVIMDLVVQSINDAVPKDNYVFLAHFWLRGFCMGQYKMTLTSFNHYKCETIKVVQIRSLLSMYAVYFSWYD